MSLLNHYSRVYRLRVLAVQRSGSAGSGVPALSRRPASCGRGGSAKAGSSGSPTVGRSGRITITWRRGGKSATCPNVFFVHFSDLMADTEGEMRRWPSSATSSRRDPGRRSSNGRARRDACRRARNGDPAVDGFEGGIARFLFKGTRALARGAHRRRSRDLRNGRGHARPGPAHLVGTGTARRRHVRRTEPVRQAAGPSTPSRSAAQTAESRRPGSADPGRGRWLSGTSLQGALDVAGALQPHRPLTLLPCRESTRRG